VSDLMAVRPGFPIYAGVGVNGGINVRLLDETDARMYGEGLKAFFHQNDGVAVVGVMCTNCPLQSCLRIYMAEILGQPLEAVITGAFRLWVEDGKLKTGELDHRKESDAIFREVHDVGVLLSALIPKESGSAPIELACLMEGDSELNEED